MRGTAKKENSGFMAESEYLEQERASETKREFLHGEVFDMAGASRRHNLIVANVIISAGSQLKQTPCRTYPSDMRLKVAETGLYAYPDVMIICGEEEFGDEKQDTLLNPDVIIEVLSDSTEGYDRSLKFAHYKKLESLREYILISQDEQKIERYLKTGGREWMYSETDATHPVMSLESAHCSLSHSEVYDKTDFPEKKEERE